MARHSRLGRRDRFRRRELERASAAVSNSVAAPAGRGAEAQACPWEGAWETQWTAGGKETYHGLVRFESAANSVMAKYDFSDAPKFSWTGKRLR